MTTDKPRQAQVRVNGAAIRAFREARGLLLSDVAGNVAKQGRSLNFASLSNIERGVKDASAPTALAIAKALRVPVAAILRVPVDAL